MTLLAWLTVLFTPIAALSAISDHNRGNLPFVWFGVVMTSLLWGAYTAATRLFTTYGV